MKCSESQTALVVSLIMAQRSFPTIAKTAEGQAGHRLFKYAPLDDVLNAVRHVLLDNGLLLTQGTEGHELVTRIDHISGEWREHRMPINAEHANMQSYGIELTYRRRYAIQPMLGIVTEDDTDGAGSKRGKGVDHTEQATAGISGTALKREAFEGLSPDHQTLLRKRLPTIVSAALTDGPRALSIASGFLDDEFPDPELRETAQMALWHLMDARTQAKLRKAAEAEFTKRKEKT